MKEYTVINDDDGNDCFTIQAENDMEAYRLALDAVGYWLSTGEEIEEEEKED